MQTASTGNEAPLVAVDMFWLPLGAVDADTMEQWFKPCDSERRQEHIRQLIQATRLTLVETLTLVFGMTLSPFRSVNRRQQHE